MQEPDSTMFFWLQEPESDKDDELVSRCNKAVHGLRWTPEGEAPAPAAPSNGAQAPSGGTNAAARPDPNQFLQCAPLSPVRAGRIPLG